MKDRMVTSARVSRDLSVYENVLRRRVRELATDPLQAFPCHGQMGPEQLEVDRLRKEVVRRKAVRDNLIEAAAYFARDVT